MKKLIFIGALILFLGFPVGVKADSVLEELDGLVIQRTAPKSLFLGQKTWVTISLENKGDREKNIDFSERLQAADFDESQAKYIETDYGEKFWYYQWKIKLPVGEKTALSYWLILQKLGSYVIPPAKISIDGKNFQVKSWHIDIKCRADGKCDLDLGENYLTCPYDCQTGMADGICDFTRDKRCDPDCKKEADPDCQGKQPKNTRAGIAYGVLIVVAVVIGAKISKKFGKK